MSVLEKDKIEFFIEDDYLILEIYDDLSFDNEPFYWKILQEKIKKKLDVMKMIDKEL